MDSNESGLAEIMFHASEKMKHGLAMIRSGFDHAGNKGDEVEAVVKEFLKEYLPESLGIGTGEIIDSKGDRSKQCDVVIYNPLMAPPMFRIGENGVFPAESVLAVIEVKTKLRESDVSSIVKAAKAVKELDRSGVSTLWSDRPQLVVSTSGGGAHNFPGVEFHRYGKKYYYPPILYFVFSFDRASLKTIGQSLENVQRGQPIDKRVDSVYCLDGDALVWVDQNLNNLTAFPDTSLEWALVPTEHVLLLFYLLTYGLLMQSTGLPRFHVEKYMSVVKADKPIVYNFPECSTPEENWRVRQQSVDNEETP